jgi:anaerobic selenocysteine-containing dehydrogenase
MAEQPMVRTIRTMCPMNCHPTFCGMLVDVEGERVVGVRGDVANPDSRGFLCMRGRAAHEIPDNPKRLRTPLRRVGPRGADRWQPIGWDEAIDTIVAAIDATERERVGIWLSHGALVTGVSRPLIMRFGHMAGTQVWTPAITCWTQGAYGLALTGLLECNTKEDMAANSAAILLWGANLASQPTTGPHLIAARRRGAHVTLIDCRHSEAARHADELIIIRPGTDAALALAMCNAIVAEGLADTAFLEQHTLGFDAFAAHLRGFTPEWAAGITGVEAEVIRALARRYATAKPAMIVLGGSSVFKHDHGWEVGRAVACLPALTGQLGIAGGGLGPRHRGLTRGDGFAKLEALDRRPPGRYVPSHMPAIEAALTGGQLDVLLILGSNMLSSFANAGAIAEGLARTRLVVAHDLFSSETIRRAADIVLPGTAWVEELGIKDTATHLYLMERVREPLAEARSVATLLRELAERLGVEEYFPWADEEEYIDAWLSPQRDANGQALTVARLRAQGGMAERGHLSHVSYPDLRFHTPSGKVEFWSARAESVGLAPLPGYTPSPFTAPEAAQAARFPLQLGQGRTLTHFHSFYDNGRALPSLAKVNTAPELWVNAADAARRGIAAGARVRVFNDGGAIEALARVGDEVPPGVVWLRDGWFGLNHLTSGAPTLTPEAGDLIDPLYFPGGQAAYSARLEIEPLAPLT